MLVTLIGKTTLCKIKLPRTVIGNYWLSNKNTKLINIESINGCWQIKSTENYRIINEKSIINKNNFISYYQNGEEIVDKVTLNENNIYFINFIESNDIYVLYCSPIYEDNYSHLHIKNTSMLFIGRDENSNHITYNNPLVSKVHAKMILLNGVWTIENYDENFNTYVNNEPISNSTKILSSGDKIFILGLTIILIGKDIFINNPFNKVKCNNNYFYLDTFNNKLINSEDEEPLKISNNENYFFRKPRMIEVIKEQEISISHPEIPKKARELPAALVLGSSISMAAMTIIMLVQNIDNIVNGKSNLKSGIFSILISMSMLVGAILLPILNNKYSKKIKRLNEKDRAEEYKKYINNKMKSIDKLYNRNREILLKTYVSEEECVNIILNNQSRLWERQIQDNDFLTVRIGIGDIPTSAKLRYSQETNVEDNNELIELMNQCIEKAKINSNFPVLLSLLDKNISAIIYNDDKLITRYIQNLILQMITFQSYNELKIVFLLNNSKDMKWEFAKMLPHVWSNSKDIRFFADEPEKLNRISEYLENEVKKRKKVEDKEYDYKSELPYYLIIIDDYNNVKDLYVINEILESDKNLGFSILFLTDSILKIPGQCQTFIEINGNKASLFGSKNFNDNKIEFQINTSEIFPFEKISQILFNILIKYEEEKEKMLPSSYAFLEMYNVGCIEQLNILDRWKNNDSTISLSAPIGIDSSGKLIMLDLHEKFHGPHGLIAGSTGSGKSEFIITYILSLAINYHPDDVNFVLIDYKGGGLAGAFKRTNIQLPHLVGTITNIDKGSLQRSLESIQSELKRRQVEFSEARLKTGESTIDIYKYQKYYHNGVLKKPISHLFIISDEFAELKQQEPEFMDELISVARIGRSLGVHLILATQKPAGVVNDQIRSNSKFGVCLKVQSPADSRDIINTGDAAKLNGAGQFYLKVGNDDYLILGQSAWAGALYYPSNDVKKDFDDSIEFVSSTGKILKKVNDIKKNNIESKGEQLTNIVKYINDIAEFENIHEKSLWLNPIPETIYIDDIRKKYSVTVNPDIIEPIIGEYDDPSNQSQNVLKLNISNGGNVIIFGNATSGKETLICTVIYDIIDSYSSQNAQMYVLDFGSESTKIFKKSPHVGDVILANESEKIARFFVMMQKEIKQRKEILSNYNGDYNLYIKSTHNVMPTIIIIINNYESFTEMTKDSYEEILGILLREGTKYHIVFVFTATTSVGIRYRTLQNFKQKIALLMNKDEEYGSIFDGLRKKRPSQLFGRGLINPEEKKFLEFQTAKICNSEEWNEHIINKIEEKNKVEKIQAKEVLISPEIVTINQLIPITKGISKFPIGISHVDISPCVIDLKTNLLNFMISNDIEEYSSFIGNIVELIKSIKNVEFTIIDSENLLSNKKEDIKAKYIDVFKYLNNSDSKIDMIVIIIGLDKLISELDSEELFLESIKNLELLENCHFIIFDSLAKLNNHTYSEWYKKYVSQNTGLWLGNGVDEQYIYKKSSQAGKLMNNCGISFGYMFTKGKPNLVKLLGMKENGEENE